MTWILNEVHWVFWGILVVVAIKAARFGIRHSAELEAARKGSRHLRVRPVSVRGGPRAVITPEKPVHSRRTRPAVPVPLDANDLDELDAMFGSAGDDPADY